MLAIRVWDSDRTSGGPHRGRCGQDRTARSKHSHRGGQYSFLVPQPIYQFHIRSRSARLRREQQYPITYLHRGRGGKGQPCQIGDELAQGYTLLAGQWFGRGQKVVIKIQCRTHDSIVAHHASQLGMRDVSAPPLQLAVHDGGHGTAAEGAGVEGGVAAARGGLVHVGRRLYSWAEYGDCAGGAGGEGASA